MENVKSLGFYSRLFLSPKPRQRWRPVIDLSRLNTFLLVERFRTEMPESIRTSLIPGEWVSSIDLSDAYLHIPIHPNSRKYLRFCHKSQMFQFTSLPFGLATAPPVFTMIVKEVKLLALTRGIRLHQYLDDWLIRAQSQEEAQVNTRTVVDLTQSLGWIINQEKTYSGVFIRGLRIPPRFSPCKTHSREMAQTSGFDPMTKVKTSFDCKIFDVANWVACLNGENGPGGTSSHGALSVSPQEHWRYPQLLDSLRPWTETFSAPLKWWQNPTNVMKGADLYPKDHSVQLFTDASNEDWGAHLEQASTKGLWSDREKRLHINVLELKAVSLALQRFKDHCQNQSSLHKQKRSSPLGGDVCSPVEDHDLVPSLPDNLKSQTHSRASVCDGRPSVQVEPSPVNRMVTAPAGVQTDLSKVVHFSCRSICHSYEPQSSTVCISSPRPKCLGHRCSEHKLVGSHCLCLPSHSSPSQGDPKNQAIQLPDHCNCSWVARDALVLEPSAALNRDPTSATSVNNTSQTVPQLCVSQQSTTSQPPRLVSRSGQLQEQGFSVEVAERIAAPQRSPTRTIYKSNGPYLRNSAEKIRWISPLPL